MRGMAEDSDDRLRHRLVSADEVTLARFRSIC